MTAQNIKLTGFGLRLLIVGILLLFFLLTGSVDADEPVEIPLQETKVVAGANLATYEDADTGFHVYGGAGVPIDDKLFVTGRYERYFADDLELNGITANFEYDMARIVTDEFELLRIYAQGNIGYYFGTFIDDSISGLGIKGGIGAEAEIAGGFGASVNLNFRPLEFEDVAENNDEDTDDSGGNINLTGIEAGLGIVYSF